MHAMLARLAEEPTPDPEPSWEPLQIRLPRRESRDPVGALWRSRRAVVAALAAALLSGTSIAYAAGVEPVRAAVDSTVDGIASLFGGSPSDDTPPGFDEEGGHGTDGEGREIDDPQTVERDEDGDGPGDEADDEENVPDDTDDDDADDDDADDDDTDDEDTDDDDTDHEDTDHDGDSSAAGNAEDDPDDEADSDNSGPGNAEDDELDEED